MLALSDSEKNAQLQTLLQDIKMFLAANNKIEGAFDLLIRLDTFLQPLSQLKQLSHNMSKKSSGMNDCQSIQIVLESDDEIGNKPIIQPRKFANLLDMFIIQYDFASKSYQIVSFYQNDQKSDTENDRKAILGLILCPIKEHCIEKQKTNSMTQLHRLTSNIPQSTPALVLPNYSNQPNKYINLFEVKECIENQGKYYLVDRYYCFITDGLAVESLDFLCRQFKSRVFEERVMKVEQPFQVNCKSIEQSLLSVLPYLVDKANELPLQLHQPIPTSWIQTQIDFSIHSTKTTLHSSFLLFITYLAICQFKIIFIVSKNSKHRLSDTILSLQGGLKPMKYAYPVVFCSLNKEHCDFVESPVPLIIGYWGSDSRKQKFVKQYQQYLTEQQSPTPSIVIDLENFSIKNETGITNQDIYAIQKINKYIKKFGKGDCLWKKISWFMKDIIQNIQKKIKQQSQWIKIFRKKLISSQMFNLHKEQ